MDTNQNQETEILDFLSFIKKFMPHYEVDGHNLEFIKNIGLWATRDKKFNGKEEGWHIDRGFIISGSVGVGKDELVRILKKYLSYLGSPYKFSSKVVWEFAKPFLKDGYDCFNEQTGNIYYEELALTNEQTGEPTREMVSYFGNKILIGAEIINVRYNVFKNSGYQTHFSTNLNDEQLEAVYGKRCMSRLYEMCNFMALPGSDRRGRVDPEFNVNKNKPAAPPKPRELDVREHEDNKSILEGYYQDFLQEKMPTIPMSLMYDTLIAYDVKVATNDQLRELMDKHEKTYVSDAPALRLRTASEKESYKSSEIWKRSKDDAVKQFFINLKENGAKTIFGERDVNLPTERRQGSINVNDILS